MKLKNNTVGFNLLVEEIFYKIPKGKFELPEEMGLLLLIMNNSTPYLNVEAVDGLVLTDDIKNNILNKYSKNGEITIKVFEPSFGRLLITPLLDVLKRKKTILIETKNQ